MRRNPKLARVFTAGVLAALLSGCAGVPRGLSPVEGFEIDRYTGLWYEIARLDHPFERGLTRVTARYEKAAGGEIRVVNRGFDPGKNEWRRIEGRALFAGSENVGTDGPARSPIQGLRVGRPGPGGDTDAGPLLARGPPGRQDGRHGGRPNHAP